MRLDRLGEGIHEELEHVLGVQFVDAPLQVVVALGQGLDDRLAFLVGQHQAQVVILDPFSPQLIQF